MHQICEMLRISKLSIYKNSQHMYPVDFGRNSTSNSNSCLSIWVADVLIDPEKPDTIVPALSLQEPPPPSHPPVKCHYKQVYVALNNICMHRGKFEETITPWRHFDASPSQRVHLLPGNREASVY